MAHMETLIGNPEQGPTPYESISLELGHGDIEAAMELYLDFTQLPQEEREKVTHFDPEKPRIGRSGYKHKGELAPDGSPLEDNKHLFHMTTALEEEFCKTWQNNPPEVRGFLSAAQEIYHSLSRSAREKYLELQEDFPLLVGVHFPRSGETGHHLRFLAYQTGKDGMLARGHYDKGTGTIAVAESHNGLRLGYGESDLTLLERGRFDPVFFPGFGWHQLAETLDVDTHKKAGWHDVVQLDEQVDEDIMRWAMVFFIDPANMYLDSTLEQTHTPVPWRDNEGLALPIDGRRFLNT